MARIPRIVIPGYPHHVTQRGNRRAPTFFEDGDYELYVALLGESRVNYLGRFDDNYDGRLSLLATS